MSGELELGPAPADEPCAQVGSDDYYSQSLQETKRYIRLLRSLNPDAPDGVRFVRRSHQHDFGTYHEVALVFDETNPTHVQYARKVEANLPANWAPCSHDGIRITKEGASVQQGSCPECGEEL